MKIGVLVSGGGTNLQAIIDKVSSGYLSNVDIECVISSKKDVYALKRAENNNIDAYVVSKKEFPNPIDFDLEIIRILKKHSVELIVLAGFLSILGEDIVNEYENRIINVHPSLIPSFCGKGFYGLKVHEEALKYGVKLTGATVHFVDGKVDHGPIILQKSINILNDDTKESLQKRVMEYCEWEILTKAIKIISENKFEIINRRVILKGESNG